ncbi:chromosome segregation ATPase [Ordospora colligata]|uniref:Chromosome segregation ATPase n=1 Tax=Ordospora colligata OC4 TaxID=1354746 RepID=A0A0B2UE08_9MICR|nr:chromosome segregation ATPase [Ordospora colligata OC4]KHN69296.1 chromosome segregation ATPase [Ordospora colligata OC4]TBU15163.1 chromosome segregation ATPase [Ordospora colligata]TBU18409.1 chromosome segregation ATPase [Ordospora colligata]
MDDARCRRLIVSIELVRFMCHDHLLIKFEKPLTVISGRNGAGKSAVMAAVGIVLGQRAQHLERGNSIKELIKNNETNAIVRIVLDNTKGFKKDFFGQRIRIEKRIGIRSTSMSIMNDDRKVWSVRREDLELLLDFFSLRFENPLSFLTQDHAKRFLNVMQPELLYELFMRGTEIDEVCRLNEESTTKTDSIRKTLEDAKRELEEISNKIDEEERYLSIVKNSREIENLIKTMEDEIEWARIAQKKKVTEELYQKVVEKQHELEEYANTIGVLEHSIMEARAMIVEIENEDAEKKKLADKRKEEIADALARLRAKDREICNDYEEMNAAKEFKTKIVSDFEKQNGVVQNECPQLESKYSELMIEQRNLEDSMEAILEKYEECKKIAVIEEDMKNERNAKMFQLRKHIEFYSRSDRESFFGPGTKELLAEISRTKFNQKVIGPIGLRIKLKEPMWAKAASIILNNTLTTFITTDKKDKEILLNIFRKHRVSFPISMPSSKVEKVLEYKSNMKYKTLLDVLRIDEPLVMNHLIITQSVEQTILIESRKNAYEVIRSRPMFVECAYTKEGDKIKMVGGGLSDFVTRGVDKLYFENTQERLERCKEELRRLEMHKEGEVKVKLKIAEEEVARTSEMIEICKRRGNALKIEIENAKRMYEIQLEVVREDGLYEEISCLENQMNLLEKKRDGIRNEIESLMREDETVRKWKRMNTMELKQMIDKQVSEVDATKMRRNACKEDVHVLNEKYKKEKEAYEQEVIMLKSNGTNEILTVRPESDIIEQISGLKAQVEMCESSRDECDVQKSLESLRKMKKKKACLIDECEEKINGIINDIQSRVAKRNLIRSTIAKNASEEFARTTKNRGYEGCLEFDHEKRTLEIRMKVHGNKECGGRSMLSGGERSYAGVCLLLSLWVSLPCPVKILDEFDVFMDNLNRKHIIKLLLQFFKDQGFQGILITPLGTEDLFEEFCDVVVLEKPSDRT